MRSSERHQLKQDQFAAKTQETLDWASRHQNALTYWTIGLVIIAVIAIGAFYYQQNREQAASALLGQAIEQYSAPIVPAGTPPVAGQPMFFSVADRAKAASGQFVEVSQKYTHTDAGTLAKYFLGLAAEDMNDNTKAEDYLKDVAGSGNKDTASLAKVALAALYHDEGRDQDAINVYKELIAKPTNTVSKATAQLRLAELYEAKDPAQAKKIYSEIAGDKDNAEPVISLANTRMAAMK
ncbi:MAG: tetratricopeptide repeat protein [Terriglobales bacterium]